MEYWDISTLKAAIECPALRILNGDSRRTTKMNTKILEDPYCGIQRSFGCGFQMKKLD